MSSALCQTYTCTNVSTVPMWIVVLEAKLLSYSMVLVGPGRGGLLYSVPPRHSMHTAQTHSFELAKYSRT